MIKSLATLLFTILAAAVHLPAAAQKPESRAEAVKIVADMRRLVMPGAIERTEAVRIGGIDQWISVRGVDRRNPVLLMIHGGPGYVSMPTSWYFQRGWEDFFTVVQWDQRGAGKTYAANDPAVVAPTMTRAHGRRHRGDGAMAAARVRQGAHLRARPFLGQLARHRTGEQASGVAARLYRHGPGYGRAGGRTARPALRPRRRSARQQCQGRAGTRIARPLRGAGPPDRAQGPVPAAQVAGLLRRRGARPQGLRPRRRGGAPGARVHRRRPAHHVEGQ